MSQSTSPYISSNLRFLRNGIRISISELAGRLNVDPIDIYKIEENDFDFSKELKSSSLLILLCHYFTVFLDDLVYTDLSQSEGMSNIFIRIIVESNGGQKYDRSQFSKGLLDPNNPALSQETVVTEESVSRKILRQIQSIDRIGGRYDYLRSKGRIDRIDFLESE